MTPELISLPWKIQIALGAGYASYLLAYLGLRKHHTASDVFFKTIVFSLVASGIFAIEIGIAAVYNAMLAIVLTIITGLIWNRWLRHLYDKLLQKIGIFYDDHPTAWLTVTHDQGNYFTQVAVLLDDGSSVECRSLAKFRYSPSGPAVFGLDGDVALYITHTTDPKGVVKELKTTTDQNYGDRLTYIPKERIARINFRKKPKN